MDTAIKYNNREEALAAFRRMQERKRKWIEDSEKELKAFAEKMDIALP